MTRRLRFRSKQRPAMRISSFVWFLCLTDAEIGAEPWESCMHPCLNFLSRWPSDLLALKRNCAAVCMQLPNSKLSHSNQFAGAWMLVLLILHLDEKQMKSITVCDGAKHPFIFLNSYLFVPVAPPSSLSTNQLLSLSCSQLSVKFLSYIWSHNFGPGYLLMLLFVWHNQAKTPWRQQPQRQVRLD